MSSDAHPTHDEVTGHEVSGDEVTQQEGTRQEVSRQEDTGQVEPEPFAALGDGELRPRTHHVVDRLDGALGLLVLRLVVAAVLGVRGLQKIDRREETVQMLRAVRMPAYDVLGSLFGPVQLAMAAALVLGLAVRVVGFGVAASAVTALVLVNWSSGSSIFAPGVAGFNGDFQLLLAGAGVALLGLGGGGFGLDRAVRHRGTVTD